MIADITTKDFLEIQGEVFKVFKISNNQCYCFKCFDEEEQMEEQILDRENDKYIKVFSVENLLNNEDTCYANSEDVFDEYVLYEDKFIS
jgi:hypothetical protein